MMTRGTALLVALSICVVFSSSVGAVYQGSAIGWVAPYKPSVKERGLYVVPTPQTTLNYHGGPLITVPDVDIYIIWYGIFSSAQKQIIRDYFASFNSKASEASPSIHSWWGLTSGYTDSSKKPASPSLTLVKEHSITRKKNQAPLSDADIEALIFESIQKLKYDAKAIYILLTGADVQLVDFCSNTCAAHYASSATKATNGNAVPFIWAGNPVTQCPGLCAWPFAKPQYGPPNFTPLVAPNDVGIDGLLISLSSCLAGTVTNPYDTGYYQGDASYPLEAATACTGIFGNNAYAGYPGTLLQNPKTKASYNSNGANGREFLLPALWNPKTSLCTI